MTRSLSFDDEESFKEAVGSLIFNNPPSDPNTTLQRELESSSSMPPHERNEGICSNNPPSDPNLLWRVGSSNSNTPHQERSEVI